MFVKEKLKHMLALSAARLMETGTLSQTELPEYKIETPKEERLGDLATNLAMVLASSQKAPPRKVAETLAANLDDPEGVLDRVEVAGPGFLNFFVKDAEWRKIIPVVLEQQDRFGRSHAGRGKRVQVEFVSANPTGPLHVGHGRGAVVGDVLANLLEASGHEVQREYYVNDAGTQMETLGRSVWLRLRERRGEKIDYPGQCYQGDYVKDLAGELDASRNGRDFASEENAIKTCSTWAAKAILDGIRADMEAFRVRFDRWFSEKVLKSEGTIDLILEELQKKDLAYYEDGALWFRSTRYGDEKDRVLVRSSGELTYFASDAAYHRDKIRRGFNTMIDVWGADHHGYIPRVRAMLDALDPGAGERLKVVLVQLVNLVRGGQPVSMSTRAGTFVTLREVMDEVGTDAARFLFLTRRADSALDFDLELAKAQTNDNPVYYVQYAHARICSVLRIAQERGISLRPVDSVNMDLLGEKEEMQIIKRMNAFPEVVAVSAEELEAHRLTYYLTDLVGDFHRFYKLHRIMGDEPERTQARLHFVAAIRTVIQNGLRLLGVDAPESM